MKKWAKEHGLLLANVGLFLAFFGGMIISGASDYSEDQVAHGQPAVGIAGYLATGAFLEATFENWESEFLQMGMYVILTVFLFQKGSSESKPMGRTAPQDQDPRDATVKAATPWPVRRGGLVLKLYEHSLSILFLLLFLASFASTPLAAAKSTARNSKATASRPSPCSSFSPPAASGSSHSRTGKANSWPWPSWLARPSTCARRGSPESKPVAEPHYETGA